MGTRSDHVDTPATPARRRGRIRAALLALAADFPRAQVAAPDDESATGSVIPTTAARRTPERTRADRPLPTTKAG